VAFADQLQESLRLRNQQAALEYAAGDELEAVLDRHLLAIEASAGGDLLTSVLLLDDDGKRLLHGAAPSLPKSYSEAIDGIAIGPHAGSCGTAAFLGHSIYVTDIARNPLWAEFKDLALAHGLRACWSTPISDAQGRLIGTFAIYHRTPRSPKPEEIDAIRTITGHVADAIAAARPSC
jgi:GAF domain-containing protein